MTALARHLDPEILDYEALYCDYQTGLVDRLRGFGAAAECLALWVPDEDPLVSLRNLWDAAANVGQPSVTLRLGAATFVQLGDDELLSMAARFGVATLKRYPQSWIIEIQELRPAAGNDEINRVQQPHQEFDAPSTTSSRHAEHDSAADVEATFARVYGLRAQQAAQQRLHQHPLPATVAGLHKACAIVDGVTLEIAVDPDSHCIRQARFYGSLDNQQRGVLEHFCSILEGLPVNEAADHGVIRLEFSLRQDWRERPVAGIVTPAATGPRLQLPQRLIRAVVNNYRSDTGYHERDSNFDPGPAQTWAELAEDVRRSMVGDVLESFVHSRGMARDALVLVDLEFAIRVVVRLGNGWNEVEVPHELLELERQLRDSLDPRIEVFLEEIRDRNKARRLAVVQGERHDEDE